MGVGVLLSLFGLGLLWWGGRGHYLVAPLGFVAWRWFGLLWVLMALPLLRRGLGRWVFLGGCMVLLVDAAAATACASLRTDFAMATEVAFIVAIALAAAQSLNMPLPGSPGL
jgi:hypothetical protein